MPGLLPTIAALTLGTGLLGIAYAARRAWKTFRAQVHTAERARIGELLATLGEPKIEKRIAVSLPPPSKPREQSGAPASALPPPLNSPTPPAPPLVLTKQQTQPSAVEPESLPVPQKLEVKPSPAFEVAVHDLPALLPASSSDNGHQGATTQTLPQPQPEPPRLPIQPMDLAPPFAQTVPVRPAPRSIPKPSPLTVRWVPAGESVQIAGQNIACGMFYVARGGSAGEDWWLVEPSLLGAGTATKLREEQIRNHPRRMLTPGDGLNCYLRWLQEDRRTLFVAQRAVSLFVEGVAVRLLRDRSALELPMLMNELQRLQSVLPAVTFSFVQHELASLLPVLGLVSAGLDATKLEAPTERAQEPSLTTRVAVGQLLQRNQPIPFSWMLAWYLESAEGYVRTPAHRAPEEFRTIAKARFEREYPSGMPVEPPRARFRVEFSTITGSLRIALPEYGELPDIATCQEPLPRMRKLIEEATDALDGYSRFIGRYPEQRNSLAALHLLPAEVVGASREKPAAAAQQWLAAQLDTSGSVDADALALFLLHEKKTRYGNKDLQRMAELLALVGYGMEPDPRYGGGALASSERAQLFPLDGDAQTGPTPAYRSAVILAETLVAVAKADGTIAPEERAAAERIGPMLGLGSAEQRRLHAHIEQLCEGSVSFAALKKKLGGLPEELRRTVARFAVSVAAADGVIEKVEIRLLEKLYDELSLPRSSLFTELHEASARAATPADEPVVVATATTGQSANRIPPPPGGSQPAGALGLDAARLQRILVETEQVSAVLGRIFQEQQEEAPLPALSIKPAIEARPSRFPGLDAQHGELLAALLERPAWTRAEYEGLARRLKLMPDGALETLNEWGFEQYDEAILDDGDPIEINRSLLSAA